jgi:restriction system protein
MPVPDYESMMLPVLRAFAEGAQNVRDCLPAVRKAFAITEEEAAALLPSGRKTVLADRVHWARTYLSKAGLLTSPRRNMHILTERGRAVLARNPEKLDNAALEEFDGFKAWRTSGRSRDPGAGGAAPVPTPAPRAETPEALIESAQAEIEAALADDLLERLRAMDALQFERLVLDLLTAMGYGTGDFGSRSLTAASGDGGIDGIIHEDALGLDAVYIQAKRYKPEVRVGSPAIREFVGALTEKGASKGVFVTSSGFSADARDVLRRVSHRIVLIDGPEMARLMIRHLIGVRVRKKIEIKGLDSDYFDELEGA